MGVYFLHLVAILIAFMFIVLGAKAKIYPLLENQNTLLTIFKDPNVDFAVRLKAIKEAKFSIDCLTYSQSLDERLGKPVLMALRDALLRGVKGRFIYQRLAGIILDPLDRTRDHLTDEIDPILSEVIGSGNFLELLRGYNPTDNFHEKILIIDAGTAYEKVWIGGRNNSLHTLGDHDFATLIRPIDYKKKSLGSQILDAFNMAREEAFTRLKVNLNLEKIEEFIDLEDSDSYIKSFKSTSNNLLETSQQFERYKKISETLNQETHSIIVDNETFFVPQKMKTITHEFFKNLREHDNHFSFSVYERSNVFNDDIFNEVDRILKDSNDIVLFNMSIDFPDKTNKRLFKGIGSRHSTKKIDFYTNSSEAHERYIPFGIPFFNSMSNLKKNFKDIKRAYNANRFNLYQFIPNKNSHYIYMHKKMIIADDYTIFGSHNFNRSATAKNNEIAILIDDHIFAKAMREIATQDQHYFEEMRPKDIKKASKDYNLLFRFINDIVIIFY